MGIDLHHIWPPFPAFISHVECMYGIHFTPGMYVAVVTPGMYVAVVTPGMYV